MVKREKKKKGLGSLLGASIFTARARKLRELRDLHPIIGAIIAHHLFSGTHSCFTFYCCLRLSLSVSLSLALSFLVSSYLLSFFFFYFLFSFALLPVTDLTRILS